MLTFASICTGFTSASAEEVTENETTISDGEYDVVYGAGDESNSNNVRNNQTVINGGTVGAVLGGLSSFGNVFDNRIIINDHFELLDEVADCRALFDKLEGVLNADWDMMYEKAAEYYNEHGDLLIPYDYHTEEGHSLGRWLRTQRDNYSGKGERTWNGCNSDH